MTGAFVLGEVTAYWSDQMAEWGGTGRAAAGILFLMSGLVFLRAEVLWQALRRIRLRLWMELLLLVVLFFLGWGRMTQEIRFRPVERFLFTQETGEKQAGSVRAAGILTELSEQNGYVTMQLSEVQLSFAAEAGEKASEFQESGVLVSVKRDLLPETLPLCGSRAEVSGKAERMKRARNPGGFDAWLYYRGKKLSVRIKADSVRFLDSGARPVYQWADAFQRWGKAALAEISCQEDRGIFQAILLGDKSELSEETERGFQKNGIAHILAVSGLHVSLIGMSVWNGLRFLGFGYGSAGVTASLLLLFYGTVTGFGASVIRAVGMALLGFLAKWLGRTYDLLSAMACSLFFLAFYSPLLLCSGGLQLSYAAVLAVGLAQEQHLPVGLVIQLFTLPVLLFHFFEFPIWGMGFNLLVLPLLPYAAASGIAGMLFFALSTQTPFGGCVLLAAAKALVGPAHYIFRLYRWLCAWGEELPFSLLTSGRPELWKLIFYYLTLLLLYRSRKQVLLFLLSLFFLCTRPVQGLQIWFLDVGQGDCVFFQTKEGTVLSDCGSSQDKRVGKQTLSPFLKSQGIRALDYVLVSHSDSDHTNGIVWLLEEERDIAVKRLLLPVAAKKEEAYQRLCEAAQKRGTEVFYFQSGDVLTLGGDLGALRLECLYPFQDNPASSGSNSDPNAHSLVVEVCYQDFSMLLTGDIGAEQEKTLVGRLQKQYQGKNRPLSILKAAHHGSAGSSSEEFLEAVRPQFTVLSYGAGNSYGHPAREAIERLEQTGTELLETAKSGAIWVSTDGTEWKIRHFLAVQDANE